jgi:hypothetical protein
MTTAYIVPIAVFNPYLAGGLLIDYLARGRYPSVMGHPPTLSPEELSVLTLSGPGIQNDGASSAAVSALVHTPGRTPTSEAFGSGLKENVSAHE